MDALEFTTKSRLYTPNCGVLNKKITYEAFIHKVAVKKKTMTF
jgi:hypothetical protein